VIARPVRVALAASAIAYAARGVEVIHGVSFGWASTYAAALVLTLVVSYMERPAR
jgi:hypothetical protein